jgi:N6-adenosine-specific RNA methylase IME4
MSIEEIKNLPVESICENNAHLYLWVTNNYLPAGLEVMKKWRFDYTTTITWVKDRFGLGQYFRGITEHCLFGVKGMIPYKVIDDKRQQGVTVINASRTEHSTKPEEMRRMIEKVSSGEKIELFARRKTLNWDSWGNQIDESSLEI